MQVITELKNRGVADIFIACVDGLKGFPEAIEAVYPQTQMQLCSGVEEYQQAVDDAYKELERSDQPVRDTVRRKSPNGRTQLKLTYTESCLGPDEQPPLYKAQQLRPDVRLVRYQREDTATVLCPEKT